MTLAADRLSPRQRDCLRLVWERQATSKEIAAELGISKSTVDGYIAEAVELLGARDRREAAAIAFSGTVRTGSTLYAVDTTPAGSGGDPARVADPVPVGPKPATSVVGTGAAVPWRTRHRPRNTLALGPTLGWIAAIAIGSLAALALATSVGNGLSPIAVPIVAAFHRLFH